MAGTYERPAYFPGVALVTDATVVSLSGRNVVEGLNFHLGVRVSGLVSDRDNTVALQTGGYRLLTYVKLDGSFSFPAVLSGTYMMYVNAVPRGRIVVGSTDMEVKDALLMPLDPQLLPGEFVKVPAGEFRMVCVNGDGAACRDFTPPLTTVKEFEIGKREVTQLQWELLMGEFAPIPRRANSNPDDLRGADRPVIGAALSGAHEYCGRLTARNDGYRYRLPTEVEYEYAGRAGGNGPYAAGPDIETRDDSARWNEMYRNRPTEPNALGLYDMTMWEWVGDPAPRGLIRGGSSRKAVGEGGSIIMPFRCVREPVRP
jgi:formylglycine-generating enzyme required for sulfatase activity